MTEKYGFRRGQGSAVRHGRLAQALLYDGLGRGKIRAGIDARQLIWVLGFDDSTVGAVPIGDGDDISEVVFALGVVIADPAQDIEQALAIHGHDAGVA